MVKPEHTAGFHQPPHPHPGASTTGSVSSRLEETYHITTLSPGTGGVSGGGVAQPRPRRIGGACWSVGTFIPFVVQSDIAHRISYLFYMLIVMPGVYIMAAQLFSPRYVPKLATVVWVGLVAFGFVALYPLRTLVGG